MLTVTSKMKIDVPLGNIVDIGCLTFILPLDIHFRPLTFILGGQKWMSDIKYDFWN